MNPTIKISFNDDVRRVKIDLNQPKALESILEQVKVAFNLQAAGPIVLKYQDEEQELVTLSTFAELLEAVRVFTDASRTLKLFVFTAATGDNIAMIPPAVTADSNGASDNSTCVCPEADQLCCATTTACAKPIASCCQASGGQPQPEPEPEPEVKEAASAAPAAKCGSKSIPSSGGCCEASPAAGAERKCICIVICCECDNGCCETKDASGPNCKIQCQPTSKAAKPHACAHPAPSAATATAVCDPCSVTCGCCNQCPVTGARFQCTVCKDFDLCQNCEEAGKHPSDHPLLKIRSDDQVKANPKSACCVIRCRVQCGDRPIRGQCYKVCVAACC